MHFGRGKVILLGEHSVVHGKPALAAGLERGVRVEISRSDRTSMHVEPWNVDVTPDGDTELSRALAALIESYPSMPPVELKVDVELPAGGGLGCSAAMGVALTRALSSAVDLVENDGRVAERSLAWERVFHGNPSGVDSAISAAGGVALFRRGHALMPITLGQTLTFVVGDSREPSSTKTMVSQVARLYERDPDRIGKTFDAIESLVRNAQLAIEAGDLRALGQLMGLNHALLSSLMLSTSALEDMCAAARDAGAEGAKLTGAGGGGCMIALARDQEIASAVQRAIEALGHRAFIAEVRA
jgi:mevalonate kinase